MENSISIEYSPKRVWEILEQVEVYFPWRSRLGKEKSYEGIYAYLVQNRFDDVCPHLAIALRDQIYFNREYEYQHQQSKR